MRNGNIVAVGERKDKLFVMKFKVITDEHQVNMAVCSSLFSWHKRIGSLECGSREENSKI